MSYLNALKELTPNQRNVVLSCFLGWTLDSFDFFIIVFVLRDIANEFKTDIPSVTATLFVTLAMRPLARSRGFGGYVNRKSFKISASA